MLGEILALQESILVKSLEKQHPQKLINITNFTKKHSTVNTPNPQVSRLIIVLRPVIMPIQAKSKFHPLGEKAESRKTPK
jgi:hypothetical protein